MARAQEGRRTHRFPVRVYYEDTDLAGIVYYANYLRFIERARSEMLRTFGIDQRAMKERERLVFAVRRLAADYHRPARFDDLLTVETRTVAVTGARIVLEQDVLRGAERLFSARVEIACLEESGRPVRIPAEIRHKLAGGGAFADKNA